ncbi:hypothetical protein KUCAC02_012518 [Chaenocephalus aceratus]|uniref:Uncharacterized protein n=1 Tax=Chaenocephalus aceratus TaxID=36190 RepID=A0ACB9XCY8_CHAAC|nr:hypothetical protein KUCAC02_012518 [Chaenocephalus aceratus]
MEDSPHLYISEFVENEDMDKMDINQEETNIASDMVKSPYQDTERDSNFFQCQHCERHFTTKPGLERHMHIHTSANNDAHKYKTNISLASNLELLHHEKVKPLDLAGSAMQLHTSSTTGSNTPILSSGDHNAQPDKPGVSEGRHACKYCGKIFTTHTNTRRHERRIHEQHLQVTHVEKAHLPQEENVEGMCSETNQQETELVDKMAPAAVLENEVGHAEQYMLDISSNISENLSFYIDGRIVSTSTISSCEAAEVHSGSATLVGLDALILDPTQISQVLNTDSEMSGQPLARRRTATPPLLPQIKTELESDVVVSSSSSSLVCSIIENLFPQNTEGTVVQKERTVFLSPKLKQLLEKQDGLKLALIADSQKPLSPVSLSVLPAGTGRFKRRTGSPPPSSPQQSPREETADCGDCEAVNTGQTETQHSSPAHQTANVKDDTTPPEEEPPTESWPPSTGGNSCNQQPLDLSNTVKSSEDVASADSALDLSFQKTNHGESELMLNLVSHAVLTEGKSIEGMMGMTLIDSLEQNISFMNPDTSLLTDFTILTSQDMMSPMQVYGRRACLWSCTSLQFPDAITLPDPSLLAAIFTVHHSIHHPCFTHRALHCSFINHSVGTVTYFKPTNPGISPRYITGNLHGKCITFFRV